MKKFYFLTTCLAAVAMLFASCEPTPTPDDENPTPTSRTVRLAASTEKQSRTTMGSDYSVLWSANDQILVYGLTSTAYKKVGGFTLVEGAGSTEGIFEGKIEEDYAAYYALYPFNIVTGYFEDGSFAVTLPSTNAIYAERNFVDGANPMVAAGTEQDGLQFKNVCGILELQLKGKGTIKSLKLEVGESDPYIAGSFTINPTTRTITAGEGASRTIIAALEKPIDLSAAPRSIYAILPPGAYSSLTLSTTDTAGETVAHTATNSITVKRSQITPVSEFTHEVQETVQLVQLDYVESVSTFAAANVIIATNTNEGAAKAMFMLLTAEEYAKEYAERRSDWAILIEAKGYIGGIVNPGTYNIDISKSNNIGGEFVMLALPVSEANKVLSLDAVKVTFKSKDVPVDSSLSASLVSSEIGSTSFSANFSVSPATGALPHALFTKQEYDEQTPATLKYYSTIFGVRQYENGSVTLNFNSLLPETDYVLVYRSANGEADNLTQQTFTQYSEMKIFTFRTKTHDYSNATVSMSLSAVHDWSADVEITTQNAAKLKLYISPNKPSADLNMEVQVDEFGNEVSIAEKKQSFVGLIEGTTYYAYALAYDAAGKYGKVASITFTTAAEITPEPSSEYDKFLGTYTFSSTNGARDDNPRDVVISKKIDGKVFRVEGLLHPLVASQIPDASYEARFVMGKLRIVAGPAADSGGYAPVWCAPFAGGFLLNHVDLIGTWSDGVITFMDAQNNGLTGLMFYQSSNGDFTGSGSLDFYDNLVLTKQGGSTPSVPQSNSTESFSRSEEVAAGWQ